MGRDFNVFELLGMIYHSPALLNPGAEDAQTAAV